MFRLAKGGELPQWGATNPKLVALLIGTNDVGSASDLGEKGTLRAVDSTVARCGWQAAAVLESRGYVACLVPAQREVGCMLALMPRSLCPLGMPAPLQLWLWGLCFCTAKALPCPICTHT